jgi:hypothetical protein
VVAQGYTIVAPWKKGGDLRARRTGQRARRDLGQARRALATDGVRRILKKASAVFEEQPHEK